MGHQRGFTLVEVIVVIGVIALLAAAIVPLAGQIMDDARMSRARSDLQSIAAAVVRHMDQEGFYPYTQTSPNAHGNTTVSAVAVLNAQPAFLRYIDKRVGDDPWGNVYRYKYRLASSPSQPHLLVYSYGPNRVDNVTPAACSDAELALKNYNDCGDDLIVHIE